MIKKGLSIVFLLIYLGVIYMPYAPYVYIVATSDSFTQENTTSFEPSFNSNMPLIGDICYLKAIKERADNGVPNNSKEHPNLIVLNNMEYVSAYNIPTCTDYVNVACDYIEYSSKIKSLIQEIDSPPPKQS